MAPKHSLLYFDLRGRGECLRLLFKHSGVEFEDRRITFADWPAMKIDVSEAPLGFLPVITTPCGKKISQTIACMQYLADEFSLYGSNSVERAIINCVLTSMKELHDEAAQIAVFTKEENEKEKQRPAHDKNIKHYFGYFERLRTENKDSKYLVGNNITVVDIFILDLVDLIGVSMPGKIYLDDFPLLKELNRDVRDSENIKNYLSERK